MQTEIPSDDPRVSAYVLNELSREERAAFEAQLALDAELRLEVNAMREAVRLATAAVTDNVRPALADHRRKAVEAAIARQMSPPRPRMYWYGAAASVAVLAGVLSACLTLLKPAPGLARVRSKGRPTPVLIAQLGAALKQYQHDFSALPPDTGYGLAPDNPNCGAGRTYDSGSLWRYLSQTLSRNGKTYGPYMRFEPDELTPYSDPCHGPSYCVINAWGTPIGYIGNPNRVVHNIGGFDLFSAGPDRKTAQDIFKDRRANLAYDGIDNDGDGVVDNSAELGVAALNGCLTVANADLGAPVEALDDINNWDQRN